MRRMRVPFSPIVLLLMPAVLAASYGIYVYFGPEVLTRAPHATVHEAVKVPKAELSKSEEKVRTPKEPTEVRKSSMGDAHEPAGARARLAEIRNAVISHGSMQEGGVCSSFELFGAGPKTEVPTPAQWQKVMKIFHAAKIGLLAWTLENRWRIRDHALTFMEKRVQDIRLQRPPTLEEPDLSYRGVGVLSDDAEGVPLIRLGSGFTRLVESSPTRAKFELTRLIAQTWAPCELEKSKIEQPWPLLLSCLGLPVNPECGAGSYSEAGWAVSSVVAVRVSPPGCELPALLEPGRLICANKLPLPLTVPLDQKVKEASR